VVCFSVWILSLSFLVARFRKRLDFGKSSYFEKCPDFKIAPILKTPQIIFFANLKIIYVENCLDL
jgi:hypothetical protein